MTNIFDMTDTWNDADVAFTAIKMNVTDTASASGSKLLDLQVGGAPHFEVSNSRQVRLYNSYTDATNYERGFARWNSNVFEIGAESAGTGGARNVGIVHPLDGAIAIRRASGGSPVLLKNSASNILDVLLGTSSYYRFNTSIAFQLDSGVQVAWGAGRADGGVDVGISRSAAGIAKVTNGSSGNGQLIFVVPTTDPNIEGALWNDGDTLAISAG